MSEGKKDSLSGIKKGFRWVSERLVVNERKPMTAENVANAILGVNDDRFTREDIMEIMGYGILEGQVSVKSPNE